MNIYQKIENFIKQESEKPSWVDEILYELREIKQLIKEDKEDKKNFQKFISKLKKKFKEDIKNGKDIEIVFKDKVYGVNMRGFFYDIDTKKEVDAKDAFEIFRFLYYNRTF